MGTATAKRKVNLSNLVKVKEATKENNVKVKFKDTIFSLASFLVHKKDPLNRSPERM